MGLARMICAFDAAWKAWGELLRGAVSGVGAVLVLSVQAARV